MAIPARQPADLETTSEVTTSPRKSPFLTVLKHVHRRAVFGRRVRVLADSLVSMIPAGASVLDIGCGDGAIASRVMQRNPSLRIHGIDLMPRPSCAIACERFDGRSIPFSSGSFDVCMFVDVLHHAFDLQGLLTEACRVSRRYVLIKDHVSDDWLDFQTLKFMDWVGNRPHGVVLPYNFQSRAQWNRHFSATGLKTISVRDQLRLYPLPFSFLFGRKLHFVELLER